MLCLSLQEPYAWLILQRAYKDDPKKPLKPIENRGWPLPKNFKVPQRVLIHASLTMYPECRGIEDIIGKMTESQWYRERVTLNRMFDFWERYKHKPDKIRQIKYFGHILGSVIITGCVTESGDPWFFGPYGFTLAYPVMLPMPIPYKGQLKFFPVEVANGA
jgi:hypothetical protein